MHKIIIIGNGFDLAHGINTSYNHFIEDYIKKIFTGSIIPNTYEDDLIKCKTRFYQTSFSNFTNNKEILEYFNLNPNSFIVKSDFLKALLNDKNISNWVDIENLFFKELFKLVYIEKKQANISKINKLNTDFEFLKFKLIEYLKEETSQHEIKASEKYLDLFLRDISSQSESLTFINFNYTNTIDKYISALSDSWYTKNKKIIPQMDRIRLINIHGRIDSKIEEPIFGIGDEHHEMYKAIKDFENIYEILKNSKSFWYQRNSNYKIIMSNLNRQINFNVEVYGHSCGLSDRTLLKNIFENNNVRKIELFHHGGVDGYIKQSYDVWRHFDNSHQYRNRLVSFKEENEMPQIR